MRNTLLAGCAALLAMSGAAWAQGDSSLVSFCGTVTMTKPVHPGGQCIVVKVVSPDGATVEFLGPAGTKNPIKEGTTLSGYGRAGGLKGAQCTGDGIPLLGVKIVLKSPPPFVCSVPSPSK